MVKSKIVKKGQLYPRPQRVKRDLIHELKSDVLQRLCNSLPHKGEFPQHITINVSSFYFNISLFHCITSRFSFVVFFVVVVN